MRNYSGVIYFSALVCAHPLALIATRRRLFSFTHLSQSLFLSGHTFLVQTTPGRDDVQSGIQGVLEMLRGCTWVFQGVPQFLVTFYLEKTRDDTLNANVLTTHSSVPDFDLSADQIKPIWM